MTDEPRYEIPGSERMAAPDASDEQPLDPQEPIDLTIVLRRRAGGELGADPADVEQVESVLRDAGLEILASDTASRRIRVRGSVATVSETFGTSIARVTSTAPDGRTVSHRQRIGTLSVPASLGERVLAVLGIDDRPQARAEFRVA